MDHPMILWFKAGTHNAQLQARHSSIQEGGESKSLVAPYHSIPK